MIIWLNGAFGSGKTTAAFELQRRLPNAFVFDPENFGYFMRKNLPESIRKEDFQDFKEWRRTNCSLLKLLAMEYQGTIIVPMTIYKKQYYDELIGELLDEGVDVRHFILYASRETLLNRLRFRIKKGDTWAVSHIDRCIHSFDHDITREKIHTDNLTVNQVVENIAGRSRLKLPADDRSQLKKKADQLSVLIKHIRSF